MVVLNIYDIMLSCNVHAYIHTHPFNGPLSGTTRVSRYQKGKTNLDFTGARDSEWQWHQHLAPDRQPRQHPTTRFFTGRMPFLPPNQQRQSTEGTIPACPCVYTDKKIIMFYYAIMAARHTVQYTHIQSYAQIHPLKHKKIFLNS